MAREKSPRSKPSALSTAERIAIWMRSLPTLAPDDQGYVMQIQRATGLSQPECSRIKAGQDATWTLKRFDQVAEHRGTTVPQLLLEVFAVSDRQAEPKRTGWKIPDETTQEYARFIRMMEFDDPARVKMTMLQFEAAFESGLACLLSDIADAVLSLGPSPAFLSIAKLIEEFEKNEPPLDKSRREKQRKRYTEKLAEIAL